MKFIRLLWGDIDRYYEQIKEAKHDNLNELVYVWGKTNYDVLINLGYDCHLIDNQKYDYTIADNHTFINYRSLIHKIIGIKLALENHNEIIFLDWDVRKIKDIDSNFYELIKNKETELQVPLYVYPKTAFDFLKKNTQDNTMINFFYILEESIKKYSYQKNGDFILPNTGFIYCSNKVIIDKLIEIITIENMVSVPDELSVFHYYKNYTMNEYIKYVEPNVIGGKEHGLEWWNESERELNKYKSDLIIKDYYFKHL